MNNRNDYTICCLWAKPCAKDLNASLYLMITIFLYKVESNTDMYIILPFTDENVKAQKGQIPFLTAVRTPGQLATITARGLCSKGRERPESEEETPGEQCLL